MPNPSLLAVLFLHSRWSLLQAAKVLPILQGSWEEIQERRPTAVRSQSWNARPKMARQAAPISLAGCYRSPSESFVGYGSLRFTKIHTESFGSQQKPLAKAAEQEKMSRLVSTERAATVSFATSGKSPRLLPDETILDASERVGVDIDYSCRTGMCGVCAIKLLSGQVAMEVEDGLEPDGKAAGMVLACQAKPVGDVAVEA